MFSLCCLILLVCSFQTNHQNNLHAQSCNSACLFTREHTSMRHKRFQNNFHDTVATIVLGTYQNCERHVSSSSSSPSFFFRILGLACYIPAMYCYSLIHIIFALCMYLFLVACSLLEVLAAYTSANFRSLFVLDKGIGYTCTLSNIKV